MTGFPAPSLTGCLVSRLEAVSPAIGILMFAALVPQELTRLNVEKML